MANEITPNLNLPLNNENDFYNIESFNNNFRLIDAWSGLVKDLAILTPQVAELFGIESEAPTINEVLTAVNSELTNKAKIGNPQFGTLSLESGVTATYTVQLSRNAFNEVILLGSVTKGSGNFQPNELFATLPEGYRPRAGMEAPAVTNVSGISGTSISINTAGQMRASTAGGVVNGSRIAFNIQYVADIL